MHTYTWHGAASTAQNCEKAQGPTVRVDVLIVVAPVDVLHQEVDVLCVASLRKLQRPNKRRAGHPNRHAMVRPKKTKTV